MSSSSLELRHLRYFVAVAEELHFGRAAMRVGIAQPPLSQQIQRLEDTVGYALFHRRPQVALTPAGNRLLAEARQLLNRADRALDAARRVGRGEAGTLRIGFAASTLLTVLPSIIRRYRQDYPEVELILEERSTTSQLAALADGAIDVGFLREPPPRPDLRAETLIAESFVAVFPPHHRRAGKSPVDLAGLADEPFVHFPRGVAPYLHDQIAEMCRRAGFTPRVVQESLEWLTILGLVAAGLGIALVPASFQRLRWGGVSYRPLRGEKMKTATKLCLVADGPSATAVTFARVARREAADWR